MPRGETPNSPELQAAQETPEQSSGSRPAKPSRAETPTGGSGDGGDRLRSLEKSFKELQNTRADFEKEGNARMVEALQREIDEFGKEIAAAGGSVEAMEKARKDADAAIALHKMIMEEPGTLPDASRDLSDDFTHPKKKETPIFLPGEEAKREEERAARSRELREETAADLARQGLDRKRPASKEAAELLAEIVAPTVKAPEKAREAGDIEASRERYIQVLETNIRKRSKQIAGLRKEIEKIGEDPSLAASKRALEKELGTAYEDNGVAILKIDKVRKRTLRETSDAEIDAAIAAPMTVEDPEEYRRTIEELSAGSAEKDVAANEKYLRFIKEEQAREALEDMTDADIEKALTKLELSVAEQHELTPAQALEAAKKLDPIIDELENGRAGTKALEKALKDEHGYDVHALRTYKKGIGAWFEKLRMTFRDPHFPFLRDFYIEKLDELNAKKNLRDSLRFQGNDPEGYRAAMQNLSLRASGPKEELPQKTRRSQPL